MSAGDAMFDFYTQIFDKVMITLNSDENRITHGVMKWPVNQATNTLVETKSCDKSKNPVGKEAKAEGIFIVIDFMKRTVIFFYEEDWIFLPLQSQVLIVLEQSAAVTHYTLHHLRNVMPLVFYTVFFRAAAT